MKISCIHPVTVKNPYTKEWIEVPCGKCPACLSRRASNWVQRIEQESSYSRFTLFFTLTYDNNFLPIYNFDVVDDYIFRFTDSSEITERSFEFNDLINFDKKSYNLYQHYTGIPYAKVTDIQKFIKRLRQLVRRCVQISEPESLLRYYIVSEYGPTTYRPHYHGILWCESEYFFSNAYDFIFKAWSSYNKHNNERTSIGRIDVQSVKGDASKYVASYLNSVSDLPKILQEKEFRPKALFSTNPPIGSHSFSRESLFSILNGKTCSFTLTQPSTYSVVSVPLWRTFENAWFPKCNGYYCLSHRDRFALYGISSLFQEFGAFKTWFLSEWEAILASNRYGLFSALYHGLNLKEKRAEIFVSEEFVRISDSLENSLLRLWRISCRVRLIRSKFNLSLNDYLTRLERYYSNKDYQCLLSQLQFEEDYVKVPGNDLRDLLTLIDPLFYENKRSLTYEVRDNYLSQFGLSIESIDKHVFTSTQNYRDMIAHYLEYVRNGKNKKLRNEYIEQHPELLKLHL